MQNDRTRIAPTQAGSDAAISAATAPRLLHLGCELTAPPEWINVDGSLNAWFSRHAWLKRLVVALRMAPRSITSARWPKNVVIADLRKPLPFADSWFDAVYSSHTMEHLFRAEAVAALKEAHRVLKPGGRCRTLVPDLGAIIGDYVEQSKSRQAGIPAAPPADDPARNFIRRLGMRGEAQPRRRLLYGIYSNLSDFHSHKWMYDAGSLLNLMEEAGFVDCRPRSFLDSQIPHLDKVEHQERARGGAIVEGQKAG